MATCNYCDTLFFLTGKSDESGRYCGVTCQQAGNLLAQSRQIPPVEVERLVWEIHHSNCPRCSGPGPIDIHKAHQVWSAIFITSWSSKPKLSCKSCGTRRQIVATITSLLFGWWGFPWGFGVTPLQVVRNIIEIAGGPKPNRPTPLLEKYVRLKAAAQLTNSSGFSKPATAMPPVINTPAPQSSEPQGDDRYMPKSLAR
jgi:hypothetical protein